MNRAEYERGVYDHERQTGQHAEEETPDVDVLATYTLQLIGPPLMPYQKFNLALQAWPGFIREAEENLTDLLPPGYSVRMKEWDDE